MEKAKRKRPPTQKDEALRLYNIVRDLTVADPKCAIVNLSLSRPLKKELDDLPNNYDAKKKCKVFLQCNGLMSFAYHVLTTVHQIMIGNTLNDGIARTFLRRHRATEPGLGHAAFGDAAEVAFGNAMDALLTHLAANYVKGVDTLEGVASCCDDATQKRMDAQWLLYPDLKQPFVAFLKDDVFTDDLVKLKESRTPLSWEVACWIACTVPHPLEVDMIVSDPPETYTKVQDAFVARVVRQNPDADHVITHFPPSKKRAKKGGEDE